MTNTPTNLNPALCQERIKDNYGRPIQCQEKKIPNSVYCSKHHAAFLEREKFLQAHPTTKAELDATKGTIAYWKQHDAEQKNSTYTESEHFCYSCNCSLDEDYDAIFYCERCGEDHDICENCRGQVHGYGEILCASCENELKLLAKSCVHCNTYNDDEPAHFVTCTRCHLVICKDCINPEDDCDFPNETWLCSTCRAGISLLDENNR
ncbi:MAG: hypothetical protein ACTSVZ_00750 [Promethearchaeota archaeon]